MRSARRSTRSSRTIRSRTSRRSRSSAREPGVLVVNPALPVKTFQEFIAYVKERPGQIDYASSGNGSGQHLFAALLASSTGLKMNHIPYKGSGQATTDLLGGQVMVSIPGTAGMVGHIKAGKLRALAVTGAKRSPQLPDVPTVMESGRAGLRGVRLDGLARAEGHAAGDHRPAPSRARCRAGDRRGEDVHGDRRHRDRRARRPPSSDDSSARRRTCGRRSSARRARRSTDARRHTASNRECHDCAEATATRRTTPGHGRRALDHQGNAGRRRAPLPLGEVRRHARRASPRCCSSTARRWPRSRRST